MHKTILQFNETEWEKLLDEVFGNDELSKIALDLRRHGVNLHEANQMYRNMGFSLPYIRAVRDFQKYVKEHGIRVSEVMTDASEIDLKVDRAWKERRRATNRSTDLDHYEEIIRTLI